MLMTTLLALFRDDTGFIISAELILVATVAVLSLIVGLSEVAFAVNQELNDVSEAIGSVNQTFSFAGFTVCKEGCGRILASGSFFNDHRDVCDLNECSITCTAPTPEGPKSRHGHQSHPK